MLATIGAFSGDYQFWVNVDGVPASGVRHLEAGQIPAAFEKA